METFCVIADKTHRIVGRMVKARLGNQVFIPLHLSICYLILRATLFRVPTCTENGAENPKDALAAILVLQRGDLVCLIV